MVMEVDNPKLLENYQLALGRLLSTVTQMEKKFLKKYNQTMPGQLKKGYGTKKWIFPLKISLVNVTTRIKLRCNSIFMVKGRRKYSNKLLHKGTIRNHVQPLLTFPKHPTFFEQHWHRTHTQIIKGTVREQLIS